MSLLQRILNFFKGLQGKPEVVAIEKAAVAAVEPAVVAAANAQISKLPANTQVIVSAVEASALSNLNKNL